tara:strand:- start:5302 stop:6015 length:714 start_codon:yes stop_codon:yes gene_type:complete
MGMTIKQMRDQIRSVIDIDSTDISDTVLNNILGQGFDTIAYSEKRWSFYETLTTFTTTQGTKDYTLDTIGASVTQGIREIIAMRTDDHILEYIGNDLADFEYPLDSIPSGEPWEWSFWNDTVRFYPSPDGAYTVHVRAIRNATSFGVGTTDATEPDIPAPFHAVLTTYGLSKAYLQQEDPLMAGQYMQQFQVELDNVARRYADMPAPQPIVANSRSSSRYLAGFGTLRYANTGGVIW